MTTRITITLDDRTADLVREAAGGPGRVSEWMATAARKRLLSDEARAVVAAADPAATAAAYDERERERAELHEGPRRHRGDAA
ncbi:hypothetical protein [Nocardia nova]